MGKTRRARPLRKRKTKRSTKHKGGAIDVNTTLVPTSINKVNTNYIASKANGTKVIINGQSITSIKPYFEGTTLTDAQQTELLDGLLKRFKLKDFYEIQKKVEEAITSNYPITKPCSKREWDTCRFSCKDKIMDLINKEIGSTAYMVRSLFGCVLWANKNNNTQVPMTLSFNGPLTGQWSDDMGKIKMELTDKSQNARLIMGFGPSAAGKTYWAETLVNLFSKVEGFPTTFFSIDGGLYRETSMIYQMIIHTLIRTCTVGFNNLAGTSLKFKTLFNSRGVKDGMMKFLQNYKGKISLYVPETLGSCGWYGADVHLGSEPCLEKYREFIEMTGDQKWIGLHIWQHESGSKCTYPPGQECKGCSESGRSREIMEGKKYSSSAYGHSKYKSDKHMREAQGGQFNIHNAGGRKTGSTFNKTTIYDLSQDRSQNPFSKILSEHAGQLNYIYSTDAVKP